MEVEHERATKEKMSQAREDAIRVSNGGQPSTPKFSQLIDEIFDKDWGEIADGATGMGFLDDAHLSRERQKTKAVLREAQNRLKKPVAMVLKEAEKREKEVADEIKKEMKVEIYQRLKGIDPSFSEDDLDRYIQSVEVY
jgi:hypothetical protein